MKMLIKTVMVSMVGGRFFLICVGFALSVLDGVNLFCRRNLYFSF